MEMPFARSGETADAVVAKAKKTTRITAVEIKRMLLLPKVKVEGRRAFAASHSNAGLGVFVIT
jgi:hypothetical protein